MHVGLALVAELSGFLGDFPCLGSNFLGWNTNLGVRFNGDSFGHVHFLQNDVAHDMLMTDIQEGFS